MRKPDFCMCENKVADQLCSNINCTGDHFCAADQSLCFHYKDSTIPPLLVSKISSI